MIDGRQDYCNGLLQGTFAANIHKLQRVQNSMARAVTNLRRNVHVKHVLASLHWLPLEHRVQFKIAVTTFKVLTTQEPSCLSELNSTPYTIPPPAVQWLQSPEETSS